MGKLTHLLVINMLNSKTIIGFLVLLATIIGLSILNKLTPEAVDAIKWIGGAFMAVRGIANHAENKYASSAENSDDTSK